jgi:beta-glucanase (GH16 family)
MLDGIRRWAFGLPTAALLCTAASATVTANTPIDPHNLERTAELTLADEFDSLSLWDGRNGRWETTFPWAVGKNGSSLASNREKQWYIEATFGPTRHIRPWSVADGTLVITARRSDAATRPLIGGYEYTSGLLTTSRSFRQTYGYFEIRARLPRGQGLWPAFWLLQPDGVWPPEIDIMEVLGSNPKMIYTTVHSGTAAKPARQQMSTRVPDTSLAWHTYSVNWQPDTTTWYFDRAVIHKTKTPRDLHRPMYLLINLAVGGIWPGDPNASTPFPASLMVDYVRVFRSKR